MDMNEKSRSGTSRNLSFPHKGGGDCENYFNSENKENRNTAPAAENRDQISDIISKLDHDIPSIRLRSIKSLLSKLEIGIISPSQLLSHSLILSQLSSSLLTKSWTDEELQNILLLLLSLSPSASFKKQFNSTALESSLLKARRIVGGKTGTLIDKLLDSMTSFDIYCKGGREAENSSYQLKLSPPSSFRMESIGSDEEKKTRNIYEHYGRVGKDVQNSPSQLILSPSSSLKTNLKNDDNNKDVKSNNLEKNNSTITLSSDDEESEFYYFDSSRTKKAQWVDFGIPKIILESSDRRVLASTVESFLSKDEKNVFFTLCFFRDVLLSDYPPEVFIQEASLSQSLYQIVESVWEEGVTNYAAFSSLFKLCSLLSIRIPVLTNPLFYQIQNPPLNFSSSSFSPISTASDSYFTNFTQFLKMISHSLSYSSSNNNSKYSWNLLSSFTKLLYDYTQVFRIPDMSKVFLADLEEVLVHISQSFLKNSSVVPLVVLASIYTNLLKIISEFGKKTEFGLSKECRRALWNLAGNLKFKRTKNIKKYFMAVAVEFETDLERASLGYQPTEFSLSVENYRSWWRSSQESYEKIPDYPPQTTVEKEGEYSILVDILHGIQNSSSHAHVHEGLDLLADYFSSLHSVGVNIFENSENKRQFFEIFGQTFSRFLSVEPNSEEDEEMLSRILDTVNFSTQVFGESEWLLELLFRKNSCLLRMILKYGQSPNKSLSFLISSIFQTYSSVISTTKIQNFTIGVQEFLTVCLEILKNLERNNGSEEAFSSPKSISLLHLALSSISICLSSNPSSINPSSNYSSLYPSSSINPSSNYSSSLNPSSSINPSSSSNSPPPPQCAPLLISALSTLLRTNVGGGGGGGGSKNKGSIRSAALSLSLLLSSSNIHLSKNREELCRLVPSLWLVEDVGIRAYSLSICSELSRSEEGTVVLLAEVEDPTLLWRFAYTRLVDPSESSFVKLWSARVLIHLINGWNALKIVLNDEIQVPLWKLLGDLRDVLAQVYWHPKLYSSLLKNKQLSQLSISQSSSQHLPESVPFITPSVFSICSKLVTRLMFLPRNFSENEDILRDVAICLLRAIGSYEQISECKEFLNDSLTSLSCGIEAILALLEKNSNLASSLISDRVNLLRIIGFLKLSQNYNNQNGNSKNAQNLNNNQENAQKIQKDLSIFILRLLSRLVVDSAQNFPDLERIITSCRCIIFPFAMSKIELSSDRTSRDGVLEFCKNFFLLGGGVKMLREERIGEELIDKLLIFSRGNLESEERGRVLNILEILIKSRGGGGGGGGGGGDENLVRRLVESFCRILNEFGVRTMDMSKSKYEKEELKTLLSSLTFLFLQNGGQEEGLRLNFPHAVHIVYKFVLSTITFYSDRQELFAILNALINFTHNFPKGAQALTVTSGLVGVTSRKTPTPSSLFIEIISLFQLELESVEKCSNVKTVELLISLINNSAFCAECRHILTKSKILNFFSKYEGRELKKWKTKAPEVKDKFLDFIQKLTYYPEFQLQLAKVTDAVEILLELLVTDPDFAFPILRNLSFHPSNRIRLLQESRFLDVMSHKLRECDNLGELESIGVSIWALVSNYEKGKVELRRSGAFSALSFALTQLKYKLHSGLRGQEESVAKIIAIYEQILNLIN